MHQTDAFALAGLWLQRLLWRLLSGCRANALCTSKPLVAEAAVEAAVWLQSQHCPAVATGLAWQEAPSVLCRCLLDSIKPARTLVLV